MINQLIKENEVLKIEENKLLKEFLSDNEKKQDENIKQIAQLIEKELEKCYTQWDNLKDYGYQANYEFVENHKAMPDELENICKLLQDKNLLNDVLYEVEHELKIQFDNGNYPTIFIEEFEPDFIFYDRGYYFKSNEEKKSHKLDRNFYINHAILLHELTGHKNGIHASLFEANERSNECYLVGTNYPEKIKCFNDEFNESLVIALIDAIEANEIESYTICYDFIKELDKNTFKFIEENEGELIEFTVNELTFTKENIILEFSATIEIEENEETKEIIINKKIEIL